MEVETLLRKQEQFVEVLEAQEGQLDEVERLAQELVQKKHFDSDNIRTRSRVLAVRYPPGSSEDVPLIEAVKSSVCLSVKAEPVAAAEPISS